MISETNAPIIVRLEHVSKKFTLRKDNSLKERLLIARAGAKHKVEFSALDNVNLDIKAGSTIGLVGHNGSGKSTLLKVIGGILDPSSGKVSRRGRLAALLELGAGFHPDLSGRDNVFLNAALLGLSRAETEHVFDDIVNFAEIGDFIDTQVKFYSSGMYVRLAFAVAVHTDPDILLVDEVLAVGDEVFQRRCMDKIHEFQADGRTIILVSHSAAQVQELCDRVIVMHRGKPIYDGNPEDGIRLLRAGYERDRLDAMQADDRVALGPHIRSIRVVSDDPLEDITVSRELPLSVAFEYFLPAEESTPPVLGLGFDTHMGQTLRGSSTKDFSLKVPKTAGTHKVVFALNQNPFSLGKYSLRGVLEREDGTLLDHLTPASYFVVVPAPGESEEEEVTIDLQLLSSEPL
ncbi:MAG: ATP-binding cassette domain-containing protein [Aeromicrobium sp.]|nr:MAG: ATP-binding cassette domain-containing protein [Aeromicrobium sp.]